MIVCTRGCCNGCGDCYGYAIGCHQDPCRCHIECTCQDFEGEYVGPCERHRPLPDPIASYQLDEDPEDAISAIEANGQAKDAARRREG